MMAAQTIESLPKSFNDIKGRDDQPQWEKAIKDELDSLKINQTWKIVPKPNNCNIVDCRWVLTIKTDECGNLVKHKARLVAKGFSQEYLVDYNETYAPVSRMTSFRVIAAIASQYDLMIHHNGSQCQDCIFARETQRGNLHANSGWRECT